MSTTTRLTLEQYDRMIADGRFEPREQHHLELIEGELRDMSPIGARHEVLVDRLTEWSFRNLAPGTVWVRVQHSIGIPQLDSAPEPDVAWVARKNYASGRPLAADVLLIVEVADSSLEYDRGDKARLYASANIADYWVVNVPEQAVEVHRRPENGRYQSVQAFGSSDQIQSLSVPEVMLKVGELFAGLPAGPQEPRL